MIQETGVLPIIVNLWGCMRPQIRHWVMIHTGTRALHGQSVHLRVYQSCWLAPSRWWPRALRHSWGDLDAVPPWQEHSSEPDAWLSICFVGLSVTWPACWQAWCNCWSLLKTHTWLKHKCSFNMNKSELSLRGTDTSRVGNLIIACNLHKVKRKFSFSKLCVRKYKL